MVLSAVYSKQDRKCTYNVTLRRVRINIVAEKKNNKYYISCVSVVLVIQHAIRTRHLVICDLFSCTIFFHIVL